MQNDPGFLDCPYTVNTAYYERLFYSQAIFNIIQHYSESMQSTVSTSLGGDHVMWMILSCCKYAKHCSAMVSPTRATTELGFISTFGGKTVASKHKQNKQSNTLINI